MAKKPTLSPEAKRILQAERRRLQRQAASSTEARITAAREALQRDKANRYSESRGLAKDALIRAVHSMVSATTTSWGIRIPISIESSHTGAPLKAYTDWRKVIIRYPSQFVDATEKGDIDALRSLIADLKGITYHEVGHNRFTVPFPNLVKMAQRSHELLSGENHRAWNVLEDQRMELAVVNESPVIGVYFTQMVANHLLKAKDPEQFILISGRLYLPKSVRMAYRRLFVEKYDEDHTLLVEDVIRRYMVATSPNDMVDAVLDLRDLLRGMGAVVPDTNTEHTSSGNPSDDAANRERIDQSAASSDDFDQQEQSEDEQQPGDGAEGDEDGESDAGASTGSDESEDGDEAGNSSIDGKSDDDADEEDGEGSPNEKDGGSDTDTDSDTPGGDGSDTSERSGKSQSDDGDLQQMLEDLLEDTADKAQNNRGIDDVIRDINEYMAGNTTSLPRDADIDLLSAESSAAADTLADGLRHALDVMVAETQPIWQARQARGVIDPFAYRTRPSGSTEYRRLYDDRGDTGTDIAVTLALDVSGSMYGHSEPLGVVAFACKKACDDIGIPCTVVTFDHRGHLVWGKDDKPEHLSFRVSGGTDPKPVLEALDAQVYDKAVHIVLMMTDGAFGTKTLPDGIRPYASDNRYFIGLGLGEGVEDSLSRAGFTDTATITNLMSIPDFLREALRMFIR